MRTGRDLQLEARAHIEVQQMIDERAADLPRPPVSAAFIEWTHREFCQRLPESLLVVVNPDTGERVPVVPGQLRMRTVAVGRHVAPAPEDLPAFMGRFEQAYDATRLTKPRRVIAVAAAHHRFLWIHPFLDGNGRVARLRAGSSSCSRRSRMMIRRTWSPWTIAGGICAQPRRLHRDGPTA
ncbi:MAG: Fic family protein, partial [Steroidobacteraceae bacterium]